ncbi:MAG: hypothetical protein H6828_13870 [Planctomycetes bacterium]|nr:hypothetical protein [Planctomycetota bacterium]
MDAVATSADAAERRASLGGVFGVALGLALIALCVAALLRGPQRLPAATVLAEAFAPCERLGALTLEPEARVLPGGERVLTFTDGSELEVTPAELVERRGMGPGMGPGMGQSPAAPDVEPFDWSSVTPEVRGAPPARLYLVGFPAEAGEAVLASAFRGLEWRELADLPKEGGAAVVGGGKLEWAGYAADWVRERRFLEGGSFRDTLRVNLTLGRRCWIAYALWPERSEGSEAAVAALLAELAPRD